jgi:hypothetical protein
MRDLLKHWPTVDNAVRRYGSWLTFLGSMAAVMTWLFDRLTVISQHGWAAVGLAAIAATCFVALVTSACLVAWRYFHPLPHVPNVLTAGGADFDSLQTAYNTNDIEELREATTLLQISVAQHKDKLAEQANTNTQLNGMLGTLDGGLEDAKKELRTLRASMESDRVAAQMLARSLRARDAEDIISDADEIVKRLVPELINASEPEFAGPGAWFTQFQTWTAAMSEIDRVVCQWQDSFVPFLHLGRADYENFHVDPPENIRTELVTPKFQTLCLVHARYTRQREALFSYFRHQASQLPY